MTVQVPENSGFWVYDGNGQVTASSVLWGDTTVTLPEDGTIVFAGDPGARFHLALPGITSPGHEKRAAEAARFSVQRSE